MRLAGRVVAITGGGSGLGADACRLARKRGARAIAVVDRDSAAAERLAAEVGGKPVTADVSSEQQVRAAVAAVEAEFGQVDVWVHNAGIGAKTSTFTPDETWQRMYGVSASRRARPRSLLPRSERRPFPATTRPAARVTGHKTRTDTWRMPRCTAMTLPRRRYTVMSPRFPPPRRSLGR